MAKLTLSVDSRVVSRAKHYAQQRGISVSSMVEAYLAAVAASPSEPAPNVPVLRRLRGALKKSGLAAYRKHLAAKYR
jgi:uncharacterized SAM-binding protein YcdF (DUF218 family)